ncbi:subtilisin-like protein [Auricularia subglabra TFB-10046 SS5]|nr:subtilisin-like protein [Auricularia subglabra TFB-10046 SS5]
MLPITPFVALSLAYLSLAQAARGLLPIPPAQGATREHGFVVSLKPSASARRGVSGTHRTILSAFPVVDALVTHEWPSLNAFAGTFSDAALLALRSSSDVEKIEHDVFGAVEALNTQTDAPWGLQRISQVEKIGRKDARSLNFTYRYDSSAGQGVDIYVVDTGVMIDHADFGGRARWGKTFGPYQDRDDFGHGTHVAGIAAGTRYGVAKSANIIALRVMNNEGGGYLSDTIAAVNWATQQVTNVTKRPSIITMSLKFDPSDVLDAAVTAAVAAGVHVTVSAGNAGVSADTQSPARARAAITVGATDINDKISRFSNFGSAVDIFAPGESIISSYIKGPNSTTVMSGTSMATPHVAGLIAYLTSLEGVKTPADMFARIQQLGPDRILSGLPGDTVNELINNGAPSY